MMNNYKVTITKKTSETYEVNISGAESKADAIKKANEVLLDKDRNIDEFLTEHYEEQSTVCFLESVQL